MQSIVAKFSIIAFSILLIHLNTQINTLYADETYQTVETISAPSQNWKNKVVEDLAKSDSIENKRKYLNAMQEKLKSEADQIIYSIEKIISKIKRRKAKSNRIWKHWFHDTLKKKNGVNIKRSQKIADFDKKIRKLMNMKNTINDCYLSTKRLIDNKSDELLDNELTYMENVQEENQQFIEDINKEIEEFSRQAGDFIGKFRPDSEDILKAEVLAWQEDLELFKLEQAKQVEGITNHMQTNTSQIIIDNKIDLEFFQELINKRKTHLSNEINLRLEELNSIETLFQQLLNTWHDRFALIQNHKELKQFINNRTPYIKRAIPVVSALGTIALKMLWPNEKKHEDCEQICPICDELADIQLECGHKLCSSCAASWWTEKINSNQFPIECFDITCKHELSDEELEKVNLSPSCLWLIKKRKLESKLRKLDQSLYIECNTPDCPGIIYAWKSRNHICSFCKKHYCFDCGDFHSPENCRREQTQQVQLNEEYLKTSMENGEIKACPSCKTPTYRIDGCNHITCPCGFHWHWRDTNRWKGYENRLGQARNHEYVYGR